MDRHVSPQVCPDMIIFYAWSERMINSLYKRSFFCIRVYVSILSVLQDAGLAAGGTAARTPLTRPP